MSIDRIDTNGNYDPDNVRWSTDEEQARNRRSNVFLTSNGVTKTVGEWATELGICRAALDHRLRKWGVERALTTPKIPGSVAARMAILPKLAPGEMSKRAERRSVVPKLEYGGVTKPLFVWAREAGIATDTLKWRLAHWPVAQALFDPPTAGRKGHR